MDPLDKQRRKRGTVRTSITNLIKKVREDLSAVPVNVETLQVALNRIVQKETTLPQMDAVIQDLLTVQVDFDRDVQESLDYMDKIIESKTLIEMKIQEVNEVRKNGSVARSRTLSQSSEDTEITKPVTVKLPKLTMAKFSGEQTKWTAFWSQYKIAVHQNQGLSEVEKFTYLQSYLEGQAAKAIQGLSISEQTYKEAVSILTRRFGNQLRIVDQHMENLLKLETVRKSSDVHGLRRLYDALEIEIRSLKALKVGSETYGQLLRTVLKQRIPPDIMLEFSRSKKNEETWDVMDLVEYLRDEIETRELAFEFQEPLPASSRETSARPFLEKNRSRPWQNSNSSRPGRSSSTAVLNVGTTFECLYCQDSGHTTNSCKKTIEDKLQFVKRERRCFICLKMKHSARNCWEKPKMEACKECNRKHHPSLCEGRTATNVDNEKPTITTQVSNFSTVTTNSVVRTVLLQTAQVKLCGEKGRNQRVRCLLDGAAQGTFVNQRLSRQLQLPYVRQESISSYGFEENKPTEIIRRVVKITLENIRDPTRRVELEAMESPNICSSLIAIPHHDVNAHLREKGLEIADEEGHGFDGQGDIGVMIGADSYWTVVTGKTEPLDSKLRAVQTIFGWVMHGPSTSTTTTVGTNMVSIMTLGISSENQLSRQIQAFWELDSMGVTENGINQNEDESIQANFKRTIQFTNGRYEVCFPWNEKKEDLTNNYEIAKRRTDRLIAKFRADPVLFSQYKDVINEQREIGIIEEVDPSRSNHANPIYYIPHQAVIRTEHDTTKLRVVYDASSSENGKLSLNDCLSSGPNLNPELLSVLLRFRNHKIALTADVEKAFLQISLSPPDRDAVRFLWKDDPQQEDYTIYRIARVPFGVTSSPYLLSATIHHHLELHQEEKKELCQLIKDNLYVDDLISGASDENKAYNIYVETKNLMKTAGMNIRKWRSNSVSLQAQWDKEENNQSKNISLTPERTQQTQKVLGLTWSPNKDALIFDLRPLLEFITTRTNSKRSVLQCVARIFDPVGFLAPFTVRMKILFQELWQLGVQWDDVLPDEPKKKFNNWCLELPQLSQLAISRHYFNGLHDSQILSKEIHVFCDASEHAYAAVAYYRYIQSDGRIKVSFIAAKTRVAPLQRITLPRLELMGAVVGARLANYLKQNLSQENTRVQMWTDSQIALHWIKGKANKWKAFVANRVIEIQSLTEPILWNHVKGKDNPADIPTRGCTVQNILAEEVWWEGPKWLKLEEEHWSLKSTEEPSEGDISEEIRSKYQETTLFSCTVTNQEKPIIDLTRYRSFTKAKRVMAFILRFIGYLKTKELAKGPFTAEELIQAEKKLVFVVQSKDFSQELSSLGRGQTISTNSPISSLNPILDNDGLIRLGGRLQKTTFSYEEKHPYILLGKNRLSELIIRCYHEKLMHSGLRDTMAAIREKFWLTRGRQVAKTLLNRCVICKRFTVKPGSTTIAPLPKDRVTQTPPFNVTGTDFAGPLYVRVNKNKTTKAYITIFTCAVTRGIHLELVSNMTTENFLMAFRRFVARRGVPSVVYSDNAKSFKRADQDLQTIFGHFKSQAVKEYLASHEIAWKFIVEKAAWWGGFYERMVRSTKMALKKVLEKASLDYEELHTLLAEVESILNSRPLTFSYNDASEPSPLCPSHFTVGERLMTVPSRVFDPKEPMSSTRQDLTKRLKYRQSLLDHFWTRWRNDYLLELRSVHQYRNPREDREFKEGDLVLVHTEKLPRTFWKTARVEELFRGRDNKVRACRVHTGNGQYLRRPIQLLYLLEVQ